MFPFFYKNTKEGHRAAKQSSCSSYMKLQLGTNILKYYTVHVYCASLAANDSNTVISPLSFLHLRDLVLGVAAACRSYWTSAPILLHVSDNSYHISLQNQHQNVLIYTTTVNTLHPRLFFSFLAGRTHYYLSSVQTMPAPWDYRQYWKINAAFPLGSLLMLST